MNATTWFETPPADWKIKRVKYASPLQTTRSDVSSDAPNYIGLENVESWTGRYIEIGNLTQIESGVSELQGTSISFKAGDVLFGKLRPYLAKALLAQVEGVGTTEFLVLRPHDELDANFLLYVLLSSNFVSLVSSSTFGAKMPRASWDFIGSITIPVPPLDTQRHIADYLDAETAQIDTLIAEKERMLALLAEKRTALVSQAVTQGLDPSVPMKPSGLEWLGKIPAHWQVMRSKQLFSVRDERSEFGDEELLTVSHITGVTLRSEKEVFMFKAESNVGYKLCYPGDLAINTLWAWMGAMGVANQLGIVSPDYHVYVSKGKLLPAFIEVLCRSKPFIAEVVRYSKGVWSSRLRLYPEAFFEIYFPVPPKDEQQAIVSALTQERSRTAELEASLQQSLALLKERRSALITAAVTGQLDQERIVR